MTGRGSISGGGSLSCSSLSPSHFATPIDPLSSTINSVTKPSVSPIELAVVKAGASLAGLATGDRESDGCSSAGAGATVRGGAPYAIGTAGLATHPGPVNAAAAAPSRQRPPRLIAAMIAMMCKVVGK